MENILFVNSCIRTDDVSRTYRLCKAFLDRYTALHPDTTVTEIGLSKLELHSLTQNDIEQRDKAIITGDTDHELFIYAKQFSSADKIVIGAPLWDLSFPSVLKVYVEHICVSGITFTYDDTTPVGLSSFSKLAYISTCGGFVGEYDCGTDYIRAITNFLGKGEFFNIMVEGLDIAGCDVDVVMNDSITRAEQLAEIF